MERPYEFIGKRLRELREDRGYSVQDVSRILGVGSSYIRQLELGYKRPTQLMSFALSELYRVVVTEIDSQVDFTGLPGFEGRRLQDY